MAAAEVHPFAGIDVSADELSVALRHGQGDHKPALAKFPNRASGHKALIAYLLRRGGRVRVCLEASGNYSLYVAADIVMESLRSNAQPQANKRRKLARRLTQSAAESACQMLASES